MEGLKYMTIEQSLEIIQPALELFQQNIDAVCCFHTKTKIWNR